MNQSGNANLYTNIYVKRPICWNNVDSLSSYSIFKFALTKWPKNSSKGVAILGLFVSSSASDLFKSL
jgi:hypothetical protein